MFLHEVNIGLSDKFTSADLLCDVACLIYDVTNPHSFQYCARMYKQYLSKSSLPVLIIGCKSEHHAVAQDYELQPIEFCHSFGLPPPQLVSYLDCINRDIYVKLASMAVFPHEVSNLFKPKSSMWIKAGIGLAILTSLGLLLLRYVRIRT